MSTANVPGVTEVDPQNAWTILENDTSAVLIDVRSQAEWTFVGVPDLDPVGKPLLQIEWKRYPHMSENPDFLSELAQSLGASAPSTLLFLCRSGARSLSAAEAVARSHIGDDHAIACVNVAEGFEGDLDAQKHRGTLSGWKARGLPWRQS
ncbi:rhodanese-like domain-containing protein [Tropicimonas sp. S265A]|uniref:rhodanese-like domain-containing protein n=1 Tax=Tropicimonas sp. S265A TaxID=3415134 RepID=UPI003C7DCB08